MLGLEALVRLFRNIGGSRFQYQYCTSSSIVSFEDLNYNLIAMPWITNTNNYGKCVALNEFAELMPVKCDSRHKILCVTKGK